MRLPGKLQNPLNRADGVVGVVAFALDTDGVENNDGYKLINRNGQPFSRESEVQIFLASSGTAPSSTSTAR